MESRFTRTLTEAKERYMLSNSKSAPTIIWISDLLLRCAAFASMNCSKSILLFFPLEIDVIMLFSESASTEYSFEVESTDFPALNVCYSVDCQLIISISGK